MPTPATRRTVIAGIATAATAMPALAAGGEQRDPIHAAIAAHAKATMLMIRVGKDSGAGDLLVTDPRWAAAEAANTAASDAFDAETERLLAVKPTTLRGVVALLEHITRFDRGAFTLGGAHRTDAYIWPTNMVGDLTNSLGRPLELPFGHWVLHQVHEALAGLA